MFILIENIFDKLFLSLVNLPFIFVPVVGACYDLELCSGEQMEICIDVELREELP